MSEANSSPLLALVKERGLVDDLQVEEVLQEQQRTGNPIARVLQDLGLVDSFTQLQVMAEHLGTDIVDIRESDIPAEVVKLIPSATARMYQCVPIAEFGSSLQVAFADPLNPQMIDELGFSIGKEVQAVVADPGSIERAIGKLYPDENQGIAQILEELTGLLDEKEKGKKGKKEKRPTEQSSHAFEVSDEADIADTAPIVKFVNLVLFQAIQDRASDIHFEPFEDQFKIRYRVDGALYEMSPPPKHLAMPVTSRLKVMANLNISERRLPQDGRIAITLGARQVDLRVSTLPTQFGESVVLRVLDRNAMKLELDALGLPKNVFDYVADAILSPNGIIVVTGPTGCGKTTTLYSMLRRINAIDSKLLTAEDPVEFDVEGIMQVQIRDSVGMTFGKALRAFLRQDPDIIMVGEMRDLDTAQISIQASLTGHLVLSTLHTNDSAGAVTRMIDMGVEPFLISSSLMAVLAQRLVRKICPKCRTSFEPTENQLSLMNLSPHDIGERSFSYGRGCGACNDTGYRGRKGIYELLPISEPVRILVNERAPTVVIRQKGIELGMVTLRDDGLRNIFDGETTVEEILKYT